MLSFPWLTPLQQAYGMTIDSIEKFGSGHIHQTFKIFSRGVPYVLQQFNAQVFTHPNKISYNHRLLIKGLEAKLLPFQLPLPLANTMGTLFTKIDHYLFRISPFVDGICLDEVADTKEAKLAAQAFAGFIEACASIDPNQFEETIPGFNNLELRFDQLKEAISNTKVVINQDVQQLIGFYLDQEELVQEYKTWIQVLPLRVTHNDTKVNNLIFSTTRSQVDAVIDLDTIMAGYAFYDFGDLVRTVACTQTESSTDWPKISVDQQKYTALWEGFLEGGKEVFTQEEIASLSFGGKMMTCIMGFRFLADYLNGNIYYTIHYKEQNLHRAKNQMLLLNALQSFNFHP